MQHEFQFCIQVLLFNICAVLFVCYTWKKTKGKNIDLLSPCLKPGYIIDTYKVQYYSYCSKYMEREDSLESMSVKMGYC